MLSHVAALAAVGSAAHVVLRRANRRLAEALDAKTVSYTACDTFSRQAIRTTLNPLALGHFAGSFLATRRLLQAVAREFRPDVIHCVSYPAILYAALAVD